jgi:hypothetical protein
MLGPPETREVTLIRSRMFVASFDRACDRYQSLNATHYPLRPPLHLPLCSLPGASATGTIPRTRTLFHVSPYVHNSCVSHTAISQPSYTPTTPNSQAAYHCRPMVGTATTDRRRKAHSKSRKGCLQCKRRHYKVSLPRSAASGRCQASTRLSIR